MAMFSLYAILLFSTPILSANTRLEYSLIQYHETVHFDVNDNILQFEAFNKSYIIELTPNEHMNPSKLHHTNGIPEHTDIEPYYTSLTQSCHYFGKVLNDNSDPLQRVSLSLCDKRGIRGEIRAFNETLIIKPTKYYDLDYDGNNFHDITDEHLVFRFSDFDTSRIPNAQSIDLSTAVPASITTAIEQKRRRLGCQTNIGCNGGNNNLELLVVQDPAQCNYYKKVYGGAWYQQLSADSNDYVNTVNGRYQALDSSFLAWSIGKMRIRMVELEIVPEYTGDYAYLWPGCLSSESSWPCQRDPNLCECTVEGTKYLDNLKWWVNNRKGASGFDSAQLISKYYFKDAAGWGWVKSTCQSYGHSNVADVYGDTSLIVASAHEIGHNLGASHDVDAEPEACENGLGMMGGATEGFSRCSFRAFQSYFWQNNGLTCLGDGVRGTTDNGGVIDTGNTDTGNSNGCNARECIGVWYVTQSYAGGDLSNYYYYDSCFNGQAVYKAGSNYLYKSTSGSWHVYSSKDNSYAYIYCSGKNDVLDCANNWMYYANGQWLKDTNSWTWDCGAGAVNVEFECDARESYGDVLCMKNFLNIHNDTAWILGELCENQQPVFTFNDVVANVSYFLSYQEYKKYIDDTEVRAKWVISQNQIGSAQEIAYCEGADLLECVEGTWKVLDIGTSDELTKVDGNSLSESVLQFVNATTMKLHECDLSVVDPQGNGDEVGMIVVIVVILLIVAALMIIGGIVLYKRWKGKGAKVFFEKERVNDDEEAATKKEEAANDVQMTNTETPTQP